MNFHSNIAVHIDIGTLRRRFVAAGILPAVEPERPARRIKRCEFSNGVEYFGTALFSRHSFRVAGRQPSTTDETSAATIPMLTETAIAMKISGRLNQKAVS